MEASHVWRMILVSIFVVTVSTLTPPNVDNVVLSDVPGQGEPLHYDVLLTAKTKKCLKECGFSCIPTIDDPPVYAGCLALCTVACKKIPIHDVAYACTRRCATSIKFMDAATSSAFVTEHYVGGYVDACYQSCFKDINLYN